MSIINNLFLFIFLYLPLVNGGKGFGAFAATTFLVTGVCLLVFWRRTADTGVVIPKIKTLHYLVAGFLLWALVSLSGTIYLHGSLIELFRLLSYAVFFYLLLFSAGTSQEKFAVFIKQAAGLLAIMATVEAIVVWTQYFLAVPRFGTVPNQNLAAAYILLGFTAGLGYFLFAPRNRHLPNWLIPGWLSLMTATIFVSHSRGVVLALILVAALMLGLKYGKKGWLVVIAGGVVLLLMLPPGKLDDLIKLSTQDGYRRIYIWQSAWNMINARPWFGWGMGNFGLVYPRYNLPSMETILHFGKVTRFAHNEILQVNAEMGWPAGILFVAIIIFVLRQGQGIFREKTVVWYRVVSFTALAGIILHSLVDFNLHLPAIALPALFFAAVLIITNPRTRYTTITYPRYLKVTISTVCLAILLAVCSFFSAFLLNQWADRMNNARPARKAEVIAAYKKAIKLNPFDSYYHQKLARIYAHDYNQEGNVYAGALAILEYQRGILLNPEEQDFYEELFYLFYQMGYPLAKIEEYYFMARRCNPYDVKMMTNMALIYFNHGKLPGAAALLEKAIGIEPNYLPAYYYLGLTKETLGQKQGAEIIYRKLVEINDLGLAKFAQSDYELKALEVPLAEVYQKLGTIYIGEKKYEAAVASFSQAVKLNPLNATLHNSLAGAYFSLGQYQPALREAQTALKLDPQNKGVQKNLALCLAAMKISE